MNIPALEANVEELDRQIARLERELEAKRLERQLTVNDIAAARLQAWYAANPGIELRVGDHLAVTDELMQRMGNAKSGDIFRVVSTGLDEDGDAYIMLTHLPTGYNLYHVPIDTARRMREAWLAQEAGA